VVIAYDDSDGWYDHAFSGVHNPSVTVADALTAPGQCGSSEESQPLGGDQGRCGYGPRQPLLIVSPWSKANFVDNALTDQTSILRFVEDNWGVGQIGNQSLDAKAGSLSNLFDFSGQSEGHQLMLDPTTGQPASGES
jgi:phospholipase C